MQSTTWRGKQFWHAHLLKKFSKCGRQECFLSLSSRCGKNKNHNSKGKSFINQIVDITIFFSSTHSYNTSQRYQIKTCKYYKKYSKKYQIFTLIWTRPEGQRPLYNTLKWLLMDYYLRNFSRYVNIKYFLQYHGH